MSDIQLISARDFERDVVEKISSVLNEDEKATWEYPIGNFKFRTDIFLEKGCKLLDLSASTFIEIKYRLTLDIGLRILSMFREEIDRRGGHLLIIYKEKLTDFPVFKPIDGIKGRATIWSYDELITKIKAGKQTDIKEDGKEHVIDPLDLARKDASTNRISLFLGAGVSMDAKLPGWNKLLERLLEQKDNIPFQYINEANTAAISKSLADSSIVTGRYVMQGFREALKAQNPNLPEEQLYIKTQEVVRERLRDVLYSNAVSLTKSELVKAIASVVENGNVENVVTYNFDDLIEHELQDPKKYESIYDETMKRSFGIKPIYHVHGFIPRDADKSGFPVLSETEYHRLYSHMHHWANVIQLNALYTTTCFFIGFSMTDPNQRRLLDLARNNDLNSMDAGKAQHYVFLQRQKLKGEAVKNVNDEHCREIENMMFELGLNVIWFDDFKNLPRCLFYVFGKLKDKPDMVN